MSLVHMKVGVTAMDLSGQKSKFGFWRWLDAWNAAYPDDAITTSIAALDDELVTLLAAVSNAGFQEIMISEVRGFGAAVLAYTGEQYPFVSDKGAFVILKEDGSLVTLELPAPKDAIIDGDSERIDLANANVASLTAALTSGNVCDSAGNLYKSVVRAYRTGEGAQPKMPGGRP